MALAEVAVRCLWSAGLTGLGVRAGSVTWLTAGRPLGALRASLACSLERLRVDSPSCGAGLVRLPAWEPTSPRAGLPRGEAEPGWPSLT